MECPLPSSNPVEPVPVLMGKSTLGGGGGEREERWRDVRRGW